MLTNIAWWSYCPVRNDNCSKNGMVDERSPYEYGPSRLNYGFKEGIQGYGCVCERE